MRSAGSPQAWVRSPDALDGRPVAVDATLAAHSQSCSYRLDAGRLREQRLVEVDRQATSRSQLELER